MCLSITILAQAIVPDTASVFRDQLWSRMSTPPGPPPVKKAPPPPPPVKKAPPPPPFKKAPPPIYVSPPSKPLQPKPGQPNLEWPAVWIGVNGYPVKLPPFHYRHCTDAHAESATDSGGQESRPSTPSYDTESDDETRLVVTAILGTDDDDDLHNDDGHDDPPAEPPATLPNDDADHDDDDDHDDPLAHSVNSEGHSDESDWL